MTIHIIGGGIASLSAAVELAAFHPVIVYEGAAQFGGRARSFHDRKLDCLIDNGNHLLLSANHSVFRYLGLIGAEKTLTGPEAPVFPWFDLQAKRGWTLNLSAGKIPFWALRRKTRVPDMRLSELASLAKLLRAGPETTVAECLGTGAFAERLMAPFSISALNTPCETASAQLLATIVRRSLMKGGRACTPWFPTIGLSESLIDPALAHLSLMRAKLRPKTRISALESERGRITALRAGDERIALAPEDRVILAVPGPVAGDLLTPHWPSFTSPDAYEAIINIHFRLDHIPVIRGVLARTRFVGLVGGIAEWIFLKDSILSVTISAANRYLDRDMDALAAQVWQEIRTSIGPVTQGRGTQGGLPEETPLFRTIVEKRATFAATPDQERKRPGTCTPLLNLFLAGDWTATGLPATLDGAVTSGVEAARAIL